MELSLSYMPSWLLRPFIMSFLTTVLEVQPSLFRDGAIMVNKRGERFCDELEHPEYKLVAQPRQHAYIVFDERLAEKYSAVPNYVSTAPGVACAYVPDYARSRKDVSHKAPTLQRVAKSFRAGRVFLIGDAAHLNNPLGGMGTNGGIHDAVNLTGRLVAVWRGDKPDVELDRFDLQRRLVTKEHVERRSIQNKKNLETAGPELRNQLVEIAGDSARTKDYLMDVSMMNSLRRTGRLG